MRCCSAALVGTPYTPGTLVSESTSTPLRYHLLALHRSPTVSPAHPSTAVSTLSSRPLPSAVSSRVEHLQSGATPFAHYPFPISSALLCSSAASPAVIHIPLPPSPLFSTASLSTSSFLHLSSTPHTFCGLLPLLLFPSFLFPSRMTAPHLHFRSIFSAAHF